MCLACWRRMEKQHFRKQLSWLQKRTTNFGWTRRSRSPLLTCQRASSVSFLLPLVLTVHSIDHTRSDLFVIIFIPSAAFSATYKASIKPYLKRLEFVSPKKEPLPGVRLIAVPGHTIGMVAVEFTAKSSDQLVVGGDAFATKVSPRPHLRNSFSNPRGALIFHTDCFSLRAQGDVLQNPEWTYYIDSHPDLSYGSRMRLFSRLAKHRTLTLSYHESFPGLGYVIDRPPFFDWRVVDSHYE